MTPMWRLAWVEMWEMKCGKPHFLQIRSTTSCTWYFSANKPGWTEDLSTVGELWWGQVGSWRRCWSAVTVASQHRSYDSKLQAFVHRCTRVRLVPTTDHTYTVTSLLPGTVLYLQYSVLRTCTSNTVVLARTCTVLRSTVVAWAACCVLHFSRSSISPFMWSKQCIAYKPQTY